MDVREYPQSGGELGRSGGKIGEDPEIVVVLGYAAVELVEAPGHPVDFVYGFVRVFDYPTGRKGCAHFSDHFVVVVPVEFGFLAPGIADETEEMEFLGFVPKNGGYDHGHFHGDAGDHDVAGHGINRIGEVCPASPVWLSLPAAVPSSVRRGLCACTSMLWTGW